VFTSRSHARALAAGLPHQDHVWITTYQFVDFHKKEFDEMICKMKSTEIPCLFEKSPTLH